MQAVFSNIEEYLIKVISKYDSVLIISPWFSSLPITAAVEHLSHASLIISDEAKVPPDMMKTFDEVYLYSSEKGMLHSKYILFYIEGEAKAVWTGSYNFTYAAQFNRENGLLIQDAEVVLTYDKDAKDLITKSKLISKRPREPDILI